MVWSTGFDFSVEVIGHLPEVNLMWVSIHFGPSDDIIDSSNSKQGQALSGLLNSASLFSRCMRTLRSEQSCEWPKITQQLVTDPDSPLKQPSLLQGKDFLRASGLRGSSRMLA